jgi:hypothetical protein
MVRTRQEQSRNLSSAMTLPLYCYAMIAIVVAIPATSCLVPSLDARMAASASIRAGVGIP